MDKKDKIGIDGILERLKYRISAVPNNENVCVALNGEWGSGKSFILEKLENDLKQSNEPRCNKILVVKYDAWKNNFYSDPLIAILFCIFDDLEKQIGLSQITKKERQKAKQVAKSVVKELLKDAANVAALLSEKIKVLNGWASAIVLVADIVKCIIQQANYKIQDNEKFNEFKSYQSLLEEAKVTLTCLTSSNCEIFSKLVILVDEIDRCLPNEQMLILERLHHLFDVKNCVVIVAINKVSVEESYTKQYSANEIGAGEKYLRKFFDYEIDIEDKNSIYLRNSLIDFFDNENRTLQEKDRLSSRRINLIISCVNCLDSVAKLDNVRNSKGLNVRDKERFIRDLKMIFENIQANEKNFITYWFATVGLYAKKYCAEYNKYTKEGYKFSKFLQLDEIFPGLFSSNKYFEKGSADYYAYSENKEVYPERMKYKFYNDNDLDLLQYAINKYLLQERNDNRGDIIYGRDTFNKLLTNSMFFTSTFGNVKINNLPWFIMSVENHG